MEFCAPLPAGAQVDWRYESTDATNFNIHYHEGKEVHFPSKTDNSQRGIGALEVKLTQDYCWMWTNRSKSDAVMLTLVLQKKATKN